MQLSLFHTETSKLTKRKKFLAEIESFLPINEWLKIIEPIYFASGARTGRPRKEIKILLRAFIIKIGTIVDSTIIDAPTSTKNEDKKCKECSTVFYTLLSSEYL